MIVASEVTEVKVAAGAMVAATARAKGVVKAVVKEDARPAVTAVATVAVAKREARPRVTATATAATHALPAQTPQ